MKKAIEAKLKIAYDRCEAEDRSTEYMIQFMADFACVSVSTVIWYLQKMREEDKKNG